MPTDSGTAMRSARSDARSVPKISGPTYSSSESALNQEIAWSSSGEAVSAGHARSTRKPATAASVRRIVIPAATAR